MPGRPLPAPPEYRPAYPPLPPHGAGRNPFLETLEIDPLAGERGTVETPEGKQATEPSIADRPTATTPLEEQDLSGWMRERFSPVFDDRGQTFASRDAGEAVKRARSLTDHDVIEHDDGGWMLVPPPATPREQTILDRQPSTEGSAPPAASTRAEESEHFEAQYDWFDRAHGAVDSGVKTLQLVSEISGVLNAARQLRQFERLKQSKESGEGEAAVLYPAGGWDIPEPALLEWRDQHKALLRERHDQDDVGLTQIEADKHARIIEGLKRIGALRDAMADIPKHPAVKAVKSAKSFGEFWNAFSDSPLNVIVQIGLESLPLMAPGIVVGVMTGGIGL